MSAEDWQGLLGRFREAHAEYDIHEFRVVAVRFVPGKDGLKRFPADLNLGAIFSAGMVAIVEPSGERVLVCFELTMSARPGMDTGIEMVSSDGSKQLPQVVPLRTRRTRSAIRKGRTAVERFLDLARTGGALLPTQLLDRMGVVEQYQPEAVWLAFLFYGCHRASAGLIYKHEREEGISILMMPFLASMRAIELELASGLPDLRVEVDEIAAYVNGKRFALTNQRHAKVLDEIVRARGNWVSSTDIKKYENERIGRMIGRFPGPIRALIESKPGSGYRLRTGVTST